VIHETADNKTADTNSIADPGPRGRLALAIAVAVDSVSGVRRSPGPGVEVATQYRGGKVTGIGLGDTVQVHIIVEVLPLEAVTDEGHWAARYALDAVGDPRPVAVTVDDIDVTALPRRTVF
jgi:hypothetical protein